MGRPSITCKATSKQTGRRCGRSPVPFTYEAGIPLCSIHGGWSPGVLARANAAFERYVRFGADEWEPSWMRNQKISAKLRSDKRREARFLRRQQKKHRFGQVEVGSPVPYEGFEGW
jgi:hypothetical protein